MKIVQVGAIITGIVITLGVLLVVPEFLRPSPTQPILLSFSVTNEQNLPNWCHDLSSVLSKYDVKAAVFVIGKVAERHPDCVNGFPSGVDIGSESYDYVSLPSISDYSTQLAEVKNGKMAVDKAGNLDSKLFKAPYGATDANIYSLLSRSNILADFSYSEQYNKYYDGKFIKFDLVTYNGSKYYTSFFRHVPADKPVLVNFDNSTPISQIDEFISEFKSKNFRFVSATELTSMDLTIYGANRT
ncbi:MAG TPA: polysaccharide deacetylase family protein [Candidatus Nitrosotalea sp.]|nr:polysaccharide deacetylase family protein [Candidatus Nitrosotalea sp.]